MVYKRTVFLLAVIGIFLFSSVSYAVANIFLSTETESGTRTTNATSITDTSASGSLAVKFGTTGSAQLMGWQVTEANIGLAPFGLNCSSLPQYTGSMSPVAGTIISQKRIVGELNSSAGNITIEKSCFQPAAGSGNERYSQYASMQLL